MRSNTDNGKEYYDLILWFCLEGKGPNKGSVIKAFCKCTGGQGRDKKYRKVQSEEELVSFTTKLSAIDPELKVMLLYYVW